MSPAQALVFQERVPRRVYRWRAYAADERKLWIIRAVLLNLGYGQEELISSTSGSKPCLEMFCEHPAKFKRAAGLLSRLNIAGVTIQQHCLAPKDWLTLWKKEWRPAALTEKLDVVPVWYKNKYRPRPGRSALYMDTLLSFGTGLHETTRMIAQMIEDHQGHFQSFLDIGTGTGILGLVALHSGAARVKGIDIGALSVQAAKDNMKANQMYFQVQRADIQKYPSKEIFDFVAANLITDDLIRFAQKIITFVRKGGYLAVSGISLGHLGTLRRAYARLPFRCLRIAKGEQWSGILYQRKML